MAAQQKKTLADRIDSLVGIFAPVAAAKRQYARYVTKHMLGSYRGADGGRIHGNWIPGGGSADQDLLQDLPKLRERSRDLVRNDGIASGAIDTIVTNIIGSGIRPQSRVDAEALKINEEYAEKLCRQIDKVWERWACTADAGNRMNFSQIQELSERSRFVNGESLIIPVRIKSSKAKRPYSLALQLIEADRMNTPADKVSEKDIRSGVRIGEYGEAVEYFVRKTHPGDLFYGSRYGNGKEEYVVYPAYNDLGDPNILHLYHVKRPGQSRGVPFFAPVITVFKNRVDYMDAELVAARVGACFSVFIKKEWAGQNAIARSTQDADKRVEQLHPGLLEYLNPGESIESFNPNRPGGTFGLFMERILRDISSGLNLPYEIIAKDFSRSNYSNTRAAFLEARRFFMMQQEFIATRLGQPVLQMLLEEAYLKGELSILDFYTNREAYVRARWIAPGWQWVDPEKEVNASAEAIDNNLTTLADECADRGLDADDVMERRAREKRKQKQLEEKFGISLEPAKSGNQAPQQPAPQKPDPKKEDPNNEEDQ